MEEGVSSLDGTFLAVWMLETGLLERFNDDDRI